jgi:mannose-6-phosphate isomerase-like protein (cupin superfamily)
MLDNIRRVVTGNDADGASVIAFDGAPEGRAGAERRGIVEIWSTERGPVDPADRVDRALPPVLLEPAAGGTKFFYFTVPPEEPGLTRAQDEERAKATFAAYGADRARAGTERSPWMHKTRTVDYIILLSGEVTLLLDGDETPLKPFDIVIQRGTNHAWVNRGPDPALLVAILMDADIV